MRHYDIASVKTGTVVGYPAKPLQDLSLEEIKKKYIRMCAKANGDLAVCSKCPTPCTEGRRAIQLLANEVYNDPPIPLYGGKTLIEKAREENMLRRKEKEEKKVDEPRKSKDNRQYIDDWYEKAVASGDPTKWVMEQYGMTRAKAKHKIYSWRYRHELTEPRTTTQAPVVKEVPVETNSGVDKIESKLDSLMKLQEKHKKIMLEYQEQYEKAKQNYEEISKKIDVLCSAMDIVNE
ncbi:MAG: hypothetical protein J6Y78_15940 [Paludibacteraceae bacterium]|nr:hypothetical protein [Paludibacteraceae bacterium]